MNVRGGAFTRFEGLTGVPICDYLGCIPEMTVNAWERQSLLESRRHTTAPTPTHTRKGGY